MRNIQNARHNEKEKFDKEFKNSLIKGKDKYTKWLRDKIDENQKEYEKREKMEEAISSLGAFATSLENTQAQKTDWALAGGFASGLAGRTAGLATALNAQNNNAVAERKAEERREKGRKMHSDITSTMGTLSSERASFRYKITDAESQIKLIAEKLFNDENIEEKFKDSVFENIGYKMSEGKNIIVNANIRLNKDIELVGSPARLDGSVKLVVKHNDKIIGTGYYCAPGFDCTDLKKVGFSDNSKIEVICIANDYTLEYDISKLSCDITPVNLWYIEC